LPPPTKYAFVLAHRWERDGSDKMTTDLQDLPVWTLEGQDDACIATSVLFAMLNVSERMTVEALTWRDKRTATAVVLDPRGLRYEP
jgi:hypothetical protein